MKTYGRKRAERAEWDIVNLDEVCRLCLSRDDNRMPIFDKDEPVPLSLRIMACVALEVVEDDGLPSTICKPCHYQLEKYYVFRKKCKSSDIKLRMHLKQLEEMSKKSFKVEEDKLDESVSTDERELVGASVTIAIPEEDEGDIEMDGLSIETNETCITLPQDTQSDSRQACTLKQDLLEEYDKDDDRSRVDVTSSNTDKNLTICEEELNEQLSAEMNDATEVSNDESLAVQVLPTSESVLTHVQLTTEDGSVVVMELTTEEPVTEKNEAGEFLVFKCEHCPKAFSRRVDLKRHSSAHDVQRGITCGVCEKWFPSQSSYNRHERIHTGDKPFECGMCERRFVQKEVLLRHMLVHSDVKPFNCTICKKGYTQREAYRVHLLKHKTSERTVRIHKCPICPKIFCHPSGLSRHLMVHNGRLYKCLDCEKLFNDRSSLRRHHRVSGHQST